MQGSAAQSNRLLTIVIITIIANVTVERSSMLMLMLMPMLMLMLMCTHMLTWCFCIFYNNKKTLQCLQTRPTPFRPTTQSDRKDQLLEQILQRWPHQPLDA